MAALRADHTTVLVARFRSCQLINSWSASGAIKPVVHIYRKKGAANATFGSTTSRKERSPYITVST